MKNSEDICIKGFHKWSTRFEMKKDGIISEKERNPQNRWWHFSSIHWCWIAQASNTTLYTQINTILTNTRKRIHGKYAKQQFQEMMEELWRNHQTFLKSVYIKTLMMNTKNVQIILKSVYESFSNDTKPF